MEKNLTPAAALKADLARETRGWLAKGVLPAAAAAWRRSAAGMVATSEARDWHLAVAAEWDRIAAKFPEKVAAAYRAKADYARDCAAKQVPGADRDARVAKWLAEAAEWDAKADAL